MQKQIVVLNGIHGSGKTTLGTLLAESEGVRFYHEIGGELRKLSTDNALQSGDSFDREVMRREVGRDVEIHASPGLAVVETWHPGNLAYARIRSPKVYEQYLRQFERSLECFSPLFVYCEIGKDTFLARATEKVAPDQMEMLYSFYLGIREETLRIYGMFGLSPVVVNNDKGLDESFHKLQAGLSLSSAS